MRKRRKAKGTAYLEPVFSAEDARRIGRAKAEGKLRPRGVQPIAQRLRYREGGRDTPLLDGGTFYEPEVADRALEQMKKHLNEWDRSSPLRFGPATTVADFIRAYYLKYEVARMTKNTRKRVALNLDRIVIPDLGHMKLGEVTVGHLKMWEADELRQRRRFVFEPSERGKGGRIRRALGLPYPRSQDEARHLHAVYELPLPLAWVPCGESSARQAITCVRRIFECAVLLKAISENPAESLTAPTGRIHDPVELDQETSYPPKAPEAIERVRLFQSPRDRCLSRWLYVQGTRPSEATALKWGQVRNYRSGDIPESTWIRSAMSERERSTTKTKGTRRIVIFEPVREALAIWFDELTIHLGHEPNEGDPVFPNLHPASKYPEMNVHSWNMRGWKRACERAGVPYFPIYCLRSTCCALLAAGGDRSAPGKEWPLVEVARHLGHSQETCEKIYYAPLPDPGRYRGVPIEDTVARSETQAAQWEMARRETILCLAEDHSVPGLLKHLSEQWPVEDIPTAGAVRRLLREAGLTQRFAAESIAARSRILELASDHEVAEIVQILNMEGYRTRRRTPWRATAVHSVLARHLTTTGH